MTGTQSLIANNDPTMVNVYKNSDRKHNKSFSAIAGSKQSSILAIWWCVTGTAGPHVSHYTVQYMADKGKIKKKCHNHPQWPFTIKCMHEGMWNNLSDTSTFQGLGFVTHGSVSQLVRGTMTFPKISCPLSYYLSCHVIKHYKKEKKRDKKNQ